MATLLEKIKQTKDWSDIIDLLKKLYDGNTDIVRPIIPELIRHHSWLVRCEILNLIGYFEMKEYLPLVIDSLSDNNKGVICYAILTYHDLFQDKAISLVKKYVGSKTAVKVRVTALAVAYIITQKNDYLSALRKIVTRGNCNYHHQMATYCIFEANIKLIDHPQIVELYKEILDKVPSDYGVVKAIRKQLTQENIQ